MAFLRASDLVNTNTRLRRQTFSFAPFIKPFRINYNPKRSQIGQLVIQSNNKSLDPLIYNSRERKHCFKNVESELVSSNCLNDDSSTSWRVPRKVLVVLNPNSGRGRSSQIFRSEVQPILKHAGFEMEVIQTAEAGHALALSSTIDLRTCPNGIICVGGDGIINEVLNGLLRRSDIDRAISVPIGIIPTGSDNSLAWSVLGIKDPVSATTAIVEGGLTSVDVFAVRWVDAASVQFGVTAACFGFVGDVLELSDKYRQYFGTIRYVIAGLMKFVSLPKYSFELEFFPSTGEKTKQNDALLPSRSEENWVKRKGEFVGILVCNHACKTVQGLNSQITAPRSAHNDGSLDLLLVHGSGRWRLLVFYIALLIRQHLLLPFVEYVKVKSVKITSTGTTQKGCGIDGELIYANGQATCSLVQHKLKLLGYHHRKQK
ncbi:Sphingoid long-chain bases kinase 1 [Carex littledalei]|uniref:Sphingoid long-chain bases kinase 1 n=1 Tax=Carex littledalei TaxID=544730 RepID=A0A833QNF4_9POAL|nr:Sphingoid long-chain bases kinase 1 [Carex littledalei]